MVALSRLRRRERAAQRAALILFARGYWVDERALKVAYREALAKFPRSARSGSPSLHPFAVAEGAAMKVSRSLPRFKAGRRLLRGARGRDESALSIVQSTFTNLFMLLLTGRPASDAGLLEALDMSGARSEDERFEHADKQVASVLRGLRMSSLQHAVASATRHELEAARDDLRLALSSRLIYRVLSRIGDRDGARHFAWADNVTDETEELVLIQGTPGMLLLRKRFGEWLSAQLETYRAARPRYEAMARMLDTMPRSLWRYLGPGGTVALTKRPARERERFVANVRAYLKGHPADGPLITRVAS